MKNFLECTHLALIQMQRSISLQGLNGPNEDSVFVVFPGVKFAEVAFCIFVFFLAPSLSFLALFVKASDRQQRLKNALVTAGVAVVGLAFATIVAVLCFPNLPDQGPIDAVAAAFIIIPYVISLLRFKKIQKLARDAEAPEDHEKRINFYLELIFGCCFCFTVGTYLFVTPPEQRALPWTAAQLTDHIDTKSMGPEFNYYLKAKISESQFKSYVNHLKLNETTNDKIQREMQLKFEPKAAKDWWDLPKVGEGLHFQRKDDAKTVSASYVGGYVYVSVVRH